MQTWCVVKVQSWYTSNSYCYIPSLRKYGKGQLKFSSLTFEDSGMYQCVAENNWGTIYANAELRVVCELHCTHLHKFVLATASVFFITFKELSIWMMFRYSLPSLCTYIHLQPSKKDFVGGWKWACGDWVQTTSCSKAKVYLETWLWNTLQLIPVS